MPSNRDRWQAAAGPANAATGEVIETEPPGGVTRRAAGGARSESPLAAAIEASAWTRADVELLVDTVGSVAMLALAYAAVTEL